MTGPVVVIADDLSGAAELASAAATLGHSAEVRTAADASPGPDVIAIDTDTRCLPPAAAAPVVARVAEQARAAGARWIYKKTDSVLRGNVRAEIEEILKTTGLGRSLFVPANPSKKRLIREGLYYVNGVPLAQTSFANDPLHPRRSSSVTELLSAAGSVPITRESGGADDFAGILVPDVTGEADLVRLAAQVDDATLPAGGVEFFVALLERRLGKHPAIPPPRPTSPLLWICGSQMAWQLGRAGECARLEMLLLIMPETLHHTSDAAHAWSELIERSLSTHDRVMVAIGEGPRPEHLSIPPESLADHLAKSVAHVLRRRPVATVCVEGGATAAALMREMDWTRLTALPTPDLPGVSALRPAAADGPLVLVKPGSYPWPEQLWESLAKGCR